MVDPILSANIEASLARGETKEQIQQSLRMRGFKDEDIVQAFGAIPTPPASNQASNQPASNNFIPSGVVPPQAPVPPSSLPIPPRLQPILQSRVQYAEPSSGRGKIILLALGILLLVGVGVAFLYGDKLTGLFVTPASDLEELAPGPTVTIPETKLETTVPVINTPPSEEAPPVVLNPDELKLQTIDQLRASLNTSFAQAGSYPQTLSVGDENIFYCYRQNGAHYILGVALVPGNTALANDLDGSYLCGKTTKNCADPVYCVGP